MYNLRVAAAMSFPHYLQHTTETKVLVGKEEHKNTYVRIDKPTYKDQPTMFVTQGGVFSIVCRPDKPVKIGEQFASVFVSGVSYTISEVIEERPAKGDWSFTDCEPILMKVRATID